MPLECVLVVSKEAGVTEVNQQLGVFTELERRLIEFDPKVSFGIKRDRWIIALMLFGTALTIPSMFKLTWGWLPWFTIAGVILELGALCVLAYRQIKDIVPDFVDAKQKFALDLDCYFLKREQILAWLSSLPVTELERRREYIESRLHSMIDRYAILFGAVDRLGMLPLMAGIFIQLTAIERISAPILIFGGALVVLYAMAIWMTRFKLQLQGYIRFLLAAEQRADPIKGDDAS